MSSRLPAKGTVLLLVLVVALWSSTAPAHAHATGSVARTTSPYEVRQGDTLSGLASRFRTTVRELVALNGVRNANRIYAGRTLLLPGAGAATASASSPAASVQGRPGRGTSSSPATPWAASPGGTGSRRPSWLLGTGSPTT